MITRSIYIGNPAYLKLKDEQMKILCPETKAEKGECSCRRFGIADAGPFSNYYFS